MNYVKLHRDLVSGKVDIDELMNYEKEFQSYFQNQILPKKEIDVEELEAFIRICNDLYVYSTDGNVLLIDSDYDIAVKLFNELTNRTIIYADTISRPTMWRNVVHEKPGMVGSIEKIYSFDELVKYLESLVSKTPYRNRTFRISPKYDGISTCIKVIDGEIVQALTRNDGYKGMDITETIQEANVYGDIADGYTKCEILMTAEDYQALYAIKPYRNRRSAVSGIINTPKNKEYARFLTVLPLAHLDVEDQLDYKPLYSKEVTIVDAQQLMDEIDEMLSVIKNVNFPFRVDGVVIMPLSKSDIIENLDDIMQDAAAYKVNSAYALSPIQYGYVSVGRLGYAIPMLKVIPVEVNETTVEDVSLGSFDKFASMDLHENEVVLLYSAGDVIPQASIPHIRDYPKNADMLIIKKRCPHCGEKLTRFGKEYQCTNQDCPRVITGKIANTMIKLGAENIADGVIEKLYTAELIRNLTDLFELQEEKFTGVKGWGEQSIQNLLNEIQRLRSLPIETSKFIGALGIRDIAEKKCRKIFQTVSLEKCLSLKRKDLEMAVMDAEGVAWKTAETFALFIKEHREEIQELMKYLNIVPDTLYKANVVFTGFRNPDYEKRLNAIGISLSNNVTSETVLVVTASLNLDAKSTKVQKAEKYGIEVVPVSEFVRYLEEVEKDML